MNSTSGNSSPAVAVDGRTEFIWIVGDPTDQVKAPQAMNPHYVAGRDNLLVVPAPIRGTSLRQVFDAARQIGNVRGWIVTVPHKIVLAPWVDELSAAAHVAGSVNAIRFRAGRTYGDLFDGQGFITGLATRGFAVAGCAALVIGAGGVGSAIALALAEAGASRICLVDIDAGRARRLAVRLAERGPTGTHFVAADLDCVTECQLVVNASPVGMNGDPRSPLDPGRLRASHVVAEVVMTPELTPLLLAARSLGCEVHPGRQVLEGQLPLLLDFFR